MKNKFLYLVFGFVFTGVSAFVIFRHRAVDGTVPFYPLVERKGPLARSTEWAGIKQTGENLIRAVRYNPDDLKNSIALATLYIQEARVTGNYSYYDQAALRYIEEVLQKEPSHFEALTLKAMLLLSQHHFGEGLELATKARDANPYNAFVYGLLVDANVELGNYKEAVKNADRMVSIRPDLRSYSRISYLRELHGDYTGAIDAMKMAVEAGGYGDEATEWARIQLAKLYEVTGERKAAEMHYTIALRERPGYAYALAGLAGLATAEKDLEKALLLFRQADSMISDPSIREGLARVYALQGDTKKKEALLDAVIQDMRTGTKEDGAGHPGHHAGKELAQACLLKGDYKAALSYAQQESRSRGNNIEIASLMAWLYYKTGETDKALGYAAASLKTGCKNPVLLCRAGVIYAGKEPVKARVLLKEALQHGPALHEDLRAEGEEAWKTF
jgi:tetratricopeptide (TPR) repeat protein